MSTFRLSAGLVLAATGAILLAACSGGSSSTPPSPSFSPSPTTHRSFSVTTPPPVATIKPGTKCTEVGDHAISATSVPYSCVLKGDKLTWTADKVRP